MATKNTMQIHVENIPKQVFMAMNRQIQMWLYEKRCHSHEQGPVKPVSKINLKISVYHGVQSDLP
jgi:hypothetical protein